MGCENECLISVLKKKKVRFLIKICIGIVIMYKFSDSLC